jgi:hypothetical protein
MRLTYDPYLKVVLTKKESTDELYQSIFKSYINYGKIFPSSSLFLSAIARLFLQKMP